MERFSYPRTYHFPWSPGVTSDDKIIKDSKQFDGKLVIATEKRDGENTTLYPDGYVHARSIDGTGKDYQSWIIRKWREVAYQLDENLRVCGENLYARHSIPYENLNSFFEVFGVYNHTHCLSWADTKYLVGWLDLPLVPTIYEGIYDEKLIKQLATDTVAAGGEGIVVRVADMFETSEFSQNVAKYVRANHVTTNEHWTKNWIPNTLEAK